MARSFYYVKNGGTAAGAAEDTNDGVYSTAKTGSWASAFSGVSEYFDSITAALASTHSVVEGDLILISNGGTAHSHVGDVTDSLPGGVMVISVSDSNCDQYTAAASAQISLTDGNGYWIAANTNQAKPAIVHGMKITSGDYGSPIAMAREGSLLVFNEVDFTNIRAATRQYEFCNDTYNPELMCINTSFTLAAAQNQSLVVGEGGVARIYGGAWTGGSSRIFYLYSKGASLECYGADFSAQGAGDNVVEISQSADKGGYAYFYGCNMFSGYTFAGLAHVNQYVVFENCDSEYHYSYHTYNGKIELQTTIQHDDDDTFGDGSTTGAYKYTCNEGSVYADDFYPLMPWAPKGSRWLHAYNDDAATNGKVRVKFGSDTALDDSNVWIICMHPDSTSTYLRTVTTWIPKPIESGSALSTQTSKWSGTGAPSNEYYYDLTMSSPGNGLVAVMVGFQNSGSAAVVYLSPQIEFVP